MVISSAEFNGIAHQTATRLIFCCTQIGLQSISSRRTLNVEIKILVLNDDAFECYAPRQSVAVTAMQSIPYAELSGIFQSYDLLF